MINTLHTFELVVNKSLLLRKISIEQASLVYNAMDTNREFLITWLPFIDAINDVNDIKSYIHSLKLNPEAYEPVFLIFYDNQFAGLIGFKNTNLTTGTTELGYWLIASMQKKGIVTTASQYLMDTWLKSTPLKRVEIKCATGNLPSKKIPVSLGYKLSQIEEKGELLASGRYTDLEVYVIQK